MGFVISVYQANEVMMAIGINVILNIFAMETKKLRSTIDFTTCAGVLLVGLVFLEMLFGFFFPGIKFINIVYACLLVSLGAFILVFTSFSILKLHFVDYWPSNN